MFFLFYLAVFTGEALMYLSEEINLAGSSVDTPYIVMFVGAFGLLLFSGFAFVGLMIHMQLK